MNILLGIYLFIQYFKRVTSVPDLRGGLGGTCPPEEAVSAL